MSLKDVLLFFMSQKEKNVVSCLKKTWSFFHVHFWCPGPYPQTDVAGAEALEKGCGFPVPVPTSVWGQGSLRQKKMARGCVWPSFP